MGFIKVLIYGMMWLRVTLGLVQLQYKIGKRDYEGPMRHTLDVRFRTTSMPFYSESD